MLLLTFTAGGEPYALDVTRVIELVPRVGLRAVPHAPAYLAGLLGYRGEVVPVVDLGILLGSSPAALRLSTRIILVNSASGGHNRSLPARERDSARDQAGHGTAAVLGLVAEQVIDLIEVGTEDVIPAPVQIAGAPYLDTIARIDRGFVPMIAVSRLSGMLGASSWLDDRDGSSSGIEEPTS